MADGHQSRPIDVFGDYEMVCHHPDKLTRWRGLWFFTGLLHHAWVPGESTGSGYNPDGLAASPQELCISLCIRRVPGT